MKKFTAVVCGGTFDLLHAGHKYFLKQILAVSEKVVIGLTSDKYVQEYKPNKGVASYVDREKNLKLFLKSVGVGLSPEGSGPEGQSATIVSIDDFYGPLLDPDLQVDALAISDHRENAMKINSMRQSRGLPPLEIVEFNLWRGEDRGKVSSTRIREGEIDRNGKNLLLPSTLRYLLQDAWGEVVSEISSDLDAQKTITVGDVTTRKFRDFGKIPKISIVDFKVNREVIEESEFKNSKIVRVRNPAGTVTTDLQNEILHAFQDDNKEVTVIIVNGEEDLAVLPALLYAPIGFEIYYGQPGVGLVRIVVDEKIKKKAKNLIDKFEIA